MLTTTIGSPVAWYNVALTDDGAGTFNVTAGPGITLTSAPEGIAYVPAGNPLFPTNAVLIANYGKGTLDAYDVNGNGNPIDGTTRQFAYLAGGSGSSGAFGTTTDPLTGDVLALAAGNLYEIRGFNVPEPSATLAAGLTAAALTTRRRRASGRR